MIKSQNLADSARPSVKGKRTGTDDIRELLDRICLLIGITVRDRNADTLRAVSHSDCLEFFRHHYKGFMIIRQTETVSVLDSRIDDLILQNRSIKAPFSFGTADSRIHIAFFVRISLDQHITVGFQIQGASHGAVGARRFRNLCIQRNFLLNRLLLLQCSRRAAGHTLTAGFASGFSQRLHHIRHHDRVESSVHQSQSTYAHDLVTDPDAEAAENTFVRISGDERMIVLKLGQVLLAAEAVGLHAVLVGQLDELTFIVIVASALQAAIGFLHRLLFCQTAEHNFGEVVFSLCRRQLIRFFTADPLSVFKGFLGDVISLHKERFLVFDRFAVKIRVNDLRSLFRVSDSFNSNGDFVVSAVTAGEHARHAGHIGVRIIGDRVLPGFVHIENARVYGLSDGQDHRIDVDSLGLSFHRNRTAASGLIRLAQLHALEHDLLHMTVLVFQDLLRIRQVLEDYAFLLGLFDFQHIGRHLIFGSSVNIVDFLRAHSDRGSAGIHRRVSASDDGNLFTEVNRFVPYHFAQEINSSDDAFRVFTRTSDAGGHPRADSEQHRVKISAHCLKRDILADLGVRYDFNAHGADQLDFAVQNLLGESVFRNSVAEHSSQLGHRVEDRDLVTHLAQEIRGRKSHRTSADDRNRFSGRFINFRKILLVRHQIVIRSETFQSHNADRLVHQCSAAVILAGMRADASDARRKRNLVLNQLVRLLIFTVGDQSDISLTVGSGGTCQGARTLAVSVMVGYQQFQVRLSGFQNALCAGHHDHSVRDVRRTCLAELGVSLNLYHTDAAGTVNLCSLIIAKRRDEDIILPGNLKDRLSRKAEYFFAVNIHSEFFHQISSFLFSDDCAEVAVFLTLAALDAQFLIDNMQALDLAGDGVDRAVSCAQSTSLTCVRDLIMDQRLT